MASDEHVASIAVSVALLSKLVDNLTTKLSEQVDHARRWSKIAVLGLILDIILTLGGAFLVYRSVENANRIDVVQDQVHQVITQVANLEGQCIFYDAMLTGYDSHSPRRLADPVKYDDAFTRLEGESYALGCAHHTRGPLTSQP